MHVVVDANVLISFFYERNEAQRQAAKVLLQRAQNGELVVVLPQVILLEMTHVLRNFYGVPAGTVAEMIHAAITFPGAVTIDDCPWREVSSAGRIHYHPSPTRSSLNWRSPTAATPSRPSIRNSFDR